MQRKGIGWHASHVCAIQWRCSLPLSFLMSPFWPRSPSKPPALSWLTHAACSSICWNVLTRSAEFIGLLVHHVFDPIAVGQPGVLIISLQGLAGAVGLLGYLAVLTLGWRAGVAALSVAAPSQRSIRFPFFYIHGTLVWVFNIKIMTSVWWSDWKNLKETIKEIGSRFMPLGTWRQICLLYTFLHWTKEMLLNGLQESPLRKITNGKKVSVTRDSFNNCHS